jgi:hypothetical protein
MVATSTTHEKAIESSRFNTEAGTLELGAKLVQTPAAFANKKHGVHGRIIPGVGTVRCASAHHARARAR